MAALCVYINNWKREKNYYCLKLITIGIKHAYMDYTKIKATLHCKKEFQRLLNFMKLVILKFDVFCQHIGKGRFLVTMLFAEI